MWLSSLADLTGPKRMGPVWRPAPKFVPRIASIEGATETKAIVALLQFSRKAQRTLVDAPTRRASQQMQPSIKRLAAGKAQALQGSGDGPGLDVAVNPPDHLPFVPPAPGIGSDHLASGVLIPVHRHV
jgi:hypothetical protein